MRSLGHQIVAEFYGCDKALLNDVAYIRNHMLEAAVKSGATIVTETFHHFAPHGRAKNASHRKCMGHSCG